VLDPVVITSTKFEKDPSETGRSVTIISREEIDNSVYTNVGELLSVQEGIYIPGSGQNPGNTQSVFSRGANSNHTLIMIDGVRLTDPSAVNNALDLSELSLNNVERIEIVRGSHSTLFGTGAIGAVINIVTKKDDKPGISGFTEVKGGNFGKGTFLLQENFYVNYTFKNGFYVNANLINLNVNGMDATADLPKPEGAFNNQDKDNFSKRDAGLKAGFRNGKWDIFASYRYNNQKMDFDNAAFEDDDNAVIRFWRDYINGGVSYKVSEKVLVRNFAGYSAMSRKSVNDSSVIDFSGNYDKTSSWNFNKGGIFNYEFQSLFKLKGIHTILGAGYYRENMTSRSYYYSNAWGPPAYISESNLDSLNLHSSIAHVFLYSDLNGEIISEKFKCFTLGLGGRFNKHDRFGNNFTYLINPSLKVTEKSLLYFSLSSGFNAPSLYQLFNPDFFAKGNQDLQAEKSFTYEAGFKQALDNFSVQLSLFNTRVNDLIQYVRLEDTATSSTLYYTYINIAEMNNKGVELAVRSKLSDKFSTFGNVGLVSGKMTYSLAGANLKDIGGNDIYLNGQKVTDEEVTSLELSRRPAYTASLGLNYSPWKKISVNVLSRFVSERKDAYYDANVFATVNITLESYSITDIQVNYLVNKYVTLNLRAENIFNKEYFEMAGYNSRRRGVFLKARVSF
jgi:vitamin B12 transporter